MIRRLPHSRQFSHCYFNNPFLRLSNVNVNYIWIKRLLLSLAIKINCSRKCLYLTALFVLNNMKLIALLSNDSISFLQQNHRTRSGNGLKILSNTFLPHNFIISTQEILFNRSLTPFPTVQKTIIRLSRCKRDFRLSLFTVSLYCENSLLQQIPNTCPNFWASSGDPIYYMLYGGFT